MANLQDTIKSTLGHLSDMTLSQRVAILLGAALVVGSLLWMVQWAATPELVPLLYQDLSAEELAQVREGLDALNETYRVDGSRVMVRADADRRGILAFLHESDKLPSATDTGFEHLIAQTNPWISGQENDRRWTVALQNELAAILERCNGVAQARVMLNLNARPRGFSRNQPQTTASVSLFMKRDEPVTRSFARAAAGLVSGAVRGLAIQDVQVIDGGTGRVALDWEAEQDGSSTDLIQRRLTMERETAFKIREQLSFDPHVRVSVSVKLDPSTMQVTDTTPSEGPVVHETTENETSTSATPAGQPGVQPNTGMEVSASTSASGSSKDSREATYQPGMKTSVQQTPPGEVESMTAAITLSYDYLESIFKRANPDAEAPTEEQIEAIFQREAKKTVALTAKLLYPPEPAQVSVEWRYPGPVLAGAEADASLGLSMDVVQRYGPLSALGVLALVAFAVMLRMAKQPVSGEASDMSIGIPKDAVEAARLAVDDLQAVAQRSKRVPVAQAGAAGGVAGEDAPQAYDGTADALKGILDAQEVGDDVMQVQSMLEQIKQMASEDADGFAMLLENWMQRGGR